MPAVGKRIENPNLYVRVGRQHQDLLIPVGGLAVVDQDTLMDAAIGSGQQRVGHQEAGRVRRENIVLHVERALRRLDHLHSRGKTVRTHR